MHEAQNEVLEELDLKDLRTHVGADTAGISNKIGELVQKAKDGGNDLDSIISEFEGLLKPKR